MGSPSATIVQVLSLLAMSAVFYPAVAVPPTASQEAVLEILKAAWGARTDLSTWVAGNDCATWRGLGCDGAGNVITLDLSGSELLKPIPAELGSLQRLTYLDLSYSQLTGSIPPQLGSLKQLTYLNFSLNLLLDPIPATLGSLAQLTRLDLSRNVYMTGPIPATLGSLKKLTYLDLSSCGLIGSIPATLGSLKQLTHLVLQRNSLTGNIPSTLGSLSNLRVLDFYINALTGPIPVALGSLQQLTYLDLSRNIGVDTPGLTGPIPTTLASLKQLTYLNLASNQLTGPIPAALGSLQQLTFLDLETNVLTGVWPTGPNAWPSLLSLGLANNALTGPVPSGFPQLGFAQGQQASGNYNMYYIYGNYFTGPVSTTVGGRPVCLEGGYGNLGLNCLDVSRIAPCASLSGYQRPATICSAFCGLAPGGPPLCNGRGTCVPVGLTQGVCDSYICGYRGACQCDPGYHNGATPSTCVPIITVPPGRGLAPPAGAPRTTAFNANFRHLSVGYLAARSARQPVWSILTFTDWRSDFSGQNRIAPVKDQGQCGSCWAFAAVATVESAYAISNSLAAAPVISEQQILNCQGADSCAGGWPGDALAYSHSGVNNGSLYPYKALKQSCTLTPKVGSSPVYSSTMWEQVDFYGWFGLLLAVQQQPVLVAIEADQRSFLSYRAGVYSDPKCFANGATDHNVVVVGFQLAAATPYWIIRNSWGDGWGMGGYMYMAIAGGDGVCGIHSSPGYYPVVAGRAPCGGAKKACVGIDCPGINPCGGGTCTPTGTATYTCTCPADFVAVRNIDGTKSCGPRHPCRFLGANPCGSGTCVDDLAGGYSCICPAGSAEGVAASGLKSCLFAPTTAPTKYTVRAQDTCYLIYTAFGITAARFAALNPKLNCKAPLKVGTVVAVTRPGGTKPCAVFYTLSATDTCASIAALLKLTQAALLKLNPGVSCALLAASGQQVCVQSGTPAFPRCTTQYLVQPGDTCQSIWTTHHLTPFQFLQYNPGVPCGQLHPAQSSALPATGTRLVCVAATTLGAITCPRGYKLYSVPRGQTCESIVFHKFGNNVRRFRAANRQFICENRRMYAGLRLCVPK